ncbi:Mitochondrial porin [Mycoemilia scoparia]|uniref:Mitochondrial porin n=1 Tax=Mycoemilia scoparia TaxID=417184 RepID=A0A9W7ZMJ3_9FUNG|nr:Mitochondrial porin [Mycoemilia scoparia]
MIPPKYADVIKPVKDLFGKDYPVGFTKLEVKTKSVTGVNFTVNGAQDIKSGAILGELKAKYTDNANGLVITDSWNTKQVVSLQVEAENNLAKGLKLDVLGTSTLDASKYSLSSNIQYKQDNIFSTARFDLLNGPAVTADVTVSRQGVIAGAEIGYDLVNGAVTKTNTTLAYAGPDYVTALQLNDAFGTLSASFYQRVSSQVEAGARATYDLKKGGEAKENNVVAEVGAKYSLDKSANVKAKVNNFGILGLSFTQALRPGVSLTLASLVDTTRFGENAHKLGASLTFEA